MISLRTLLLAGAGFLAAAVQSKADADEETPPLRNRAELWVPADKLSSVLKKYPKAVLLSRVQYETLLREAAPKEPLLDEPPREAALVSAAYRGRVDGKVLTVEGELVAQVLTGEWAQLPLNFSTLALAEVKVDGEGALAAPPAPTMRDGKAVEAAQLAVDQPVATMLLLRGKGPHKIAVRFATAIATTDAWHGATLGLPAAGANSLVVDFPAHTLAECTQPLRTEALPDATRVTVALPLDSCQVLLRWRSSGGGLVALPTSLESKTAFTIDAESVQARSDLTVSTATGTLPETLEFALAGDARLVEVTGSDVAGWTVEGQRVRLQLPPGRGAKAEFSTVVQRATGLAQAPREVALPLPELVGAGRVAGEFSVVGGSGVAVRELAATPGTAPLPPASGLAGSWRFLGPNVAPKIRVERLRPRFHADLDTLLDFQSEAIFIERTVTLHPEEGGVYHLLVTLPAGEEVLTVRGVSGLTSQEEQAAKKGAADFDPLWRVEGQALSLRWLADPPPGHPRTVWVRTRLEPAGWAAGVGRTAATQPAAGEAETFTFPVTEAKLEGAEKVSGYLALRASENFRLETEAADTLEPRDGRTTPVTGAYAWFRRGDFDLKVRVTRRPSELLATLTGYALPLAGVLDLHAQIAWDFRYAGVRSVQVRVPEKQADDFHFEGPQIAERTRAGDTWTIVFQKELTGRQVLGVTAQIPIEKTADDASRFITAVPVIEPLHTQRGSGTWVIEANTDTEIALTATGMNELDALLAPPLEGYQPRHRVIGVFTWLGPTYGLSLSGVRHAGASVLTTVVDSFGLVSVVATTGVVRSEAVLQLRTAGAQFLDVTLPAASRLLSLLVEGEPSKPVEGRPGEVRVQLPAKPDTTAATELRVLYETSATLEWKSRGTTNLAPLRLPREVPVLTTTWRAFLPEGYYYSGGENNLTPTPSRWERPLVLAPLAFWNLRQTWQQISVLSQSGVADPRAVSMDLATLQGKDLDRYSRLGGNSSETYWDAPRFFTIFDKGSISAKSRGAKETAESDSSYNKTVGPKARVMGEQVKSLYDQARALVDAGRYDLADKRCEEILQIDPYDLNARKMQSQIVKMKEDFARGAYDQTRSFALWKSTKAWDSPVRRFGDMPMGAAATPVPSRPGDTLVTKEWTVPPGLLALPPDGTTPDVVRGGSGIVKQRDPQEFLTAAGITFPPGSVATYSPELGKLTVTNTRSNLDLIDVLSEPAGEHMRHAVNLPVGGEEARHVGLLPMKLDLPKVGEEMLVSGVGAPEAIKVKYFSEHARARRLWLVFFLGAIAYAIWSGPHPWWRSAWITLALTAIPLCLAPSATSTCNLLLAGWLAALVLGRLVRRFIFHPTAAEEAIA